MTTNVIDLALHVASFPSTYIGDGNLIGNPVQSAPAMAISGYFTGAGNVVSIPVGSQPTDVTIVDETDNIVWNWSRGLAATHSIKSVSGAQTIDSTSAIVVSTDLAGNCSITLSAALATLGSNLIYRIEF